ncbi:hypothetical protein Bhyg_14564 [Pseudolycoriella hygida]|uniref:Uncharacterized protein n=1 Tax=Pseudolycoriella hygida TaxID=35572 RepID=A0A9Q0RXJ8_9DIPT|nr:hypothetical protein Bhyg_14564 [Pseudolycoriella hygida]
MLSNYSDSHPCVFIVDLLTFIADLLMFIVDLPRFIGDLLRSIGNSLKFSEALLGFIVHLLRFIVDLLRFIEDLLRCIGDFQKFNGGLLRFIRDLLRFIVDLLTFIADLLMFIVDLLRFNVGHINSFGTSCSLSLRQFSMIVIQLVATASNLFSNPVLHDAFSASSPISSLDPNRTFRLIRMGHVIIQSIVEIHKTPFGIKTLVNEKADVNINYFRQMFECLLSFNGIIRIYTDFWRNKNFFSHKDFILMKKSFCQRKIHDSHNDKRHTYYSCVDTFLASLTTISLRKATENKAIPAVRECITGAKIGYQHCGICAILLEPWYDCDHCNEYLLIYRGN